MDPMPIDPRPWKYDRHEEFPRLQFWTATADDQSRIFVTSRDTAPRYYANMPDILAHVIMTFTNDDDWEGWETQYHGEHTCFCSLDDAVDHANVTLHRQTRKETER